MEWRFFDFVELSGRNHIRDWLVDLCDADEAIIDRRLIQMAAMATWPEKWVSKYRSRDDIYEFRIKGTVQLRPLGTYFGRRRYILLAGAIEKGGKLPLTDVTKAIDRKEKVTNDERHAAPHDFGIADDMEEDEGEEIS